MCMGGAAAKKQQGSLIPSTGCCQWADEQEEEEEEGSQCIAPAPGKAKMDGEMTTASPCRKKQ